jgi:hypothetical protein
MKPYEYWERQISPFDVKLIAPTKEIQKANKQKHIQYHKLSNMNYVSFELI